MSEITNGLLRRFFSKGIEISKLPNRQIDGAVYRINARPRVMLNYWSPLEFLVDKRLPLMLAI
ncbi:hypothetical protein ACJJI3_05560 [Microbulbifer sp. ZKSA004]|uniref:hypothetical protein n=1 Tax=Microbulbifer sp. ZKSA004 TaxID=3243389 RepID=UPI004039D91B